MQQVLDKLPPAGVALIPPAPGHGVRRAEVVSNIFMSRYLKYILGSSNSLLSEIVLPQLEFSSRAILRHHLVAVLLVVPAVSNITNSSSHRHCCSTHQLEAWVQLPGIPWHCSSLSRKADTSLWKSFANDTIVLTVNTLTILTCRMDV